MNAKMDTMTNTNKIDLFDKIINVELAGSGGSDKVECPDKGRKPAISIKGKFVQADIIQEIELRMTNFYPKKSLSDYTNLRITAGYKNNLQTKIEGVILNSYQESPPPDGVTVFEIITGDLVKFTTETINKNYSANTSLSTILQDVADSLGLTLKSNIRNVTVPVAYQFNGLAKDLLHKIKTNFPTVVIRPEGTMLYVFDEADGTGVVHNLEYIKNAKKDGFGFTITCPWNPAIKPGDNVMANPKYYKASIGSSGITGGQFYVVSVDFEFDTCGEINTMNILTTSKKNEQK
jgi:hypothetical protein